MQQRSPSDWCRDVGLLLLAIFLLTVVSKINEASPEFIARCRSEMKKIWKSFSALPVTLSLLTSSTSIKLLTFLRTSKRRSLTLMNGLWINLPTKSSRIRLTIIPTNCSELRLRSSDLAQRLSSCWNFSSGLTLTSERRICDSMSCNIFSSSTVNILDESVKSQLNSIENLLRLFKNEFYFY